MMQIEQLTKHFGNQIAVDDVSFTVTPGRVTGFLGPNGAGKSTTMRMIVGLDRPTSGRVTIAGRPYADHPDPLRQVGALLDATSFHRGRTAFDHLRALAQTHGLPSSRVNDVLAQTGLESVAHRRTGGFSLGMGQRLGIAAALIGDPAVLILDEPVNGLDPDGVIWIRTLLTSLAAEGRTVLISSHLMSEMALTADQLLIIGRGRLLADISLTDLIARAGVDEVLVRSPQASELRQALIARSAPAPATIAGTGTGTGTATGTGTGTATGTGTGTATVAVTAAEPGLLRVRGLSAEQIGEAAASRALVLHELVPQRASLEQAYLQLTRDAVTLEPDPERRTREGALQ